MALSLLHLVMPGSSPGMSASVRTLCQQGVSPCRTGSHRAYPLCLSAASGVLPAPAMGADDVTGHI
jgi:hypothetical protein